MVDTELPSPTLLPVLESHDYLLWPIYILTVGRQDVLKWRGPPSRVCSAKAPSQFGWCPRACLYLKAAWGLMGRSSCGPWKQKAVHGSCTCSQASVGQVLEDIQSALWGEGSHIRIAPPLRRQGNEIGLLVGHYGYVVSVWNSSFRALGRELLNSGWTGCFICCCCFLGYL